MNHSQYDQKHALNVFISYYIFTLKSFTFIKSTVCISVYYNLNTIIVCINSLVFNNRIIFNVCLSLTNSFFVIFMFYIVFFIISVLVLFYCKLN